MNEPVCLSSKEYPNLDAILAGTIGGNFRDWPAVRPELIKLVAEVEKLKAENEKHREQRDTAIHIANAEITKLRSALERVEYICDDIDGEARCVWCCDTSPNHSEDCERQIALKGGK